jgi:hypothetical protein
MDKLKQRLVVELTVEMVSVWFGSEMTAAEKSHAADSPQLSLRPPMHFQEEFVNWDTLTELAVTTKRNRRYFEEQPLTLMTEALGVPPQNYLAHGVFCYFPSQLSPQKVRIEPKNLASEVLKEQMLELLQELVAQVGAVLIVVVCLSGVLPWMPMISFHLKEPRLYYWVHWVLVTLLAVAVCGAIATAIPNRDDRL